MSDPELLQDFNELVEPVEPREHLMFDPKRRGWTAVIGGIATFAAAAGFWAASYQKAGQIISFDPSVEVEDNTDGMLVSASLNVHGELEQMADELEEFEEKKCPYDILALQEAKPGDVEFLHERFPEKYINGVVTDSKSNLFSGRANIFMSNQELTDIDRIVLTGSGLKSESERTIRGVARGSSVEIVDATQEHRAIISGNIKVATSEGVKEVRYSNLHLSGDRFTHPRHLDGALKYFEEQKQEGVISIAIGDFNTPPNQATQALTSIGFMVPPTGPTTKDAIPKVVDYYAQEASLNSYLYLPTAKVIPMKGSDHNAICATVHAQ